MRKIAIMVLDHCSNFEVIHGILDLLMTKVSSKMGTDYKLVEDHEDPCFLTGRGVSIVLHDRKIESMGVLHPEVLGNFELKYPVSALEICFDPMFDHFKSRK